MGNKTPRTLQRRGYTTDQRIELLEYDMDGMEGKHREAMDKLDRIYWALIGLGLTIAGSAASLLVARSFG